MFESLYQLIYHQKCVSCGERFFWTDSHRLHIEGHVFVDVVKKLADEGRSGVLLEVADDLQKMADRVRRFGGF